MRLGMKLVVAALFLGGCATGQRPSPSAASAEKVWGDWLDDEAQILSATRYRATMRSST